MDKGNVGFAVALYAAVEGKGAPASKEDECEGEDRVKRIEKVLESRAVWSLQLWLPGFIQIDTIADVHMMRMGNGKQRDLRDLGGRAHGAKQYLCCGYGPAGGWQPLPAIHCPHPRLQRSAVVSVRAREKQVGAFNWSPFCAVLLFYYQMLSASVPPGGYAGERVGHVARSSEGLKCDPVGEAAREGKWLL